MQYVMMKYNSTSPKTMSSGRVKLDETSTLPAITVYKLYLPKQNKLYFKGYTRLDQTFDIDKLLIFFSHPCSRERNVQLLWEYGYY